MTKTLARTSVSRALGAYMALVACACCVARSEAQGSVEARPRVADSGKAAPIFGLKIPSGYRCHNGRLGLRAVR